MCKICHSNDLELSENKGYENICIGCECQIDADKLEAKWNKELSVYEKRTGLKLDFDEFCNECWEERINIENLHRLPELKSVYEQNKYEREEYFRPRNPQQEFEFEPNDLPF